MKYGIKSFVKNFISLSGIQILTMLIPLITLPYLIRVIGVDDYGFYAFIVSIMLFTQVFIDFGTTNYGAREVAIIVHDDKNPKNLVNSVIKTRFTLFSAVFTTVFISIYLIPADYFSDIELKVIVFSLLTPLAYALSCDWYFIGVQKNFIYLKINAVFKTLSLILIFWFVKVPADIWIVPLILGGGLILTSISVLIYIQHFFMNDTRVITNKLNTIEVMKLSYKVFLTKLSLDLYRGINPVAIGVIAGYQYVTYYVAAERVISALQMLQFPLGRALMPIFTRIFKNEGYPALLKSRRKIMTIAIAIYLVVFANLMVFSNEIARLLIGNVDQNTVFVLQILSVSFMFACFNYLNYMIVIIPSHLDSFFVKRLAVIGIQNLVFLMPLVYFYKEAGAAISLLTAEVLLTSVIARKIYQLKREA